MSYYSIQGSTVIFHQSSSNSFKYSLHFGTNSTRQMDVMEKKVLKVLFSFQIPRCCLSCRLHHCSVRFSKLLKFYIFGPTSNIFVYTIKGRNCIKIVLIWFQFLFQKELIHTILNTLSGPFSVQLVVRYLPNKVFLGPFGTKIGDIFYQIIWQRAFFLLMAWKLTKLNFQILFEKRKDKQTIQKGVFFTF